MTIIVRECDSQYAVCRALNKKYNDIEFFGSHDIQDNIMIKKTSEGTFMCESFEDNTDCRTCEMYPDTKDDHEHTIYMKVTEVVGDNWTGRIKC